ncbi:MAG: nicotinate-nucleotide adenylyltransferase [Amaricoccus sp.]|uniref:nicotinate-nucleotide adenylyltransferase n=1 Tax=Amaricoccus sp. TaxID=1872485 RepID=UPI0039E54808
MLPGGPAATPGQRIGLLGGSFDPPHAGHVHITRRALTAFGLDAVWWLVTPGNPLKPDAPADLERRMAAARALMRHPRVRITDLERRLGTRYTAATLAALRLRYPGVRFVWLMGSDNLASFHRWDRWEEIFATVPVGVLARPGQQLHAGLSPAARRFARWRVPQAGARSLALQQPPAWCLLSGRMLDLSSSGLRALGIWRR